MYTCYGHERRQDLQYIKYSITQAPISFIKYSIERSIACVCASEFAYTLRVFKHLHVCTHSFSGIHT